MDFIYTLFHFIVAIALLVSFHEFGHFWVARRCGVKVLRFSIGFGHVVWSYQKNSESTEYALSAIPLGGYVKMVDEREGTVKKADLPFAFNRQPLLSRAAIVAAGPIFNLVLAVALYWMVAMIGEMGMRPIVDTPEPDTLAYQAGFSRGEEITTVNNKRVITWTQAMTAIFSSAMESDDPIHILTNTPEGVEQSHQLQVSEEEAMKPKQLFTRLGFQIAIPNFKPIIGKILDNGAAAQSGLKIGDLIVSVDRIAIRHWQQWVDYIQQHPQTLLKVLVSRDGVHLPLQITPKRIESGDQSIGQIGAGLHIDDDELAALRVYYSLPIGEALISAFNNTYSNAFLSLKMMGKMLIGKASVENLSGPISIAKYAGQSAERGIVPFLKFLAIVSVSLGVLNLLPVPVLDGGHLLFYAIEAIKGSPVSEKIQIVFQQIGIFLLVSLMLFSIFLDIGRLFE
jgi:regulator of sigma E protease